MKKISMVIPTYNEKANIIDDHNRLTNIMRNKLSNYDYEILFIDNHSTDGTRDLLQSLAKSDTHVKVIFNSRNVGWSKSSYYGLLNSSGDCTVLLAADMQEPPEVMCEFIKHWENGHKIVVGVKSKSEENKFVYFLRNLYYKLLDSIADIHHIKQFMGFGLYDKSFINILRNLDEPLPYFRGIVAELGYNIKEVEYTQEKRKKGNTHFSLMKVYELAMLGITSYTRTLLSISTIIGSILCILSLLCCMVLTILCLTDVLCFSISNVLLWCGLFFVQGIQLGFIGLLGEYILNINARTMKRPLVIEEKRLNFNSKE